MSVVVGQGSPTRAQRTTQLRGPHVIIIRDDGLGGIRTAVAAAAAVGVAATVATVGVATVGVAVATVGVGGVITWPRRMLCCRELPR